MKLTIKNMVCDRCNKVVREVVESLGLRVMALELGQLQIGGTPKSEQLQLLNQKLEAEGFEILYEQKKIVAEHIKTLIIEEVQYAKGNKPTHVNFSDFLSKKCGYDYSYLSHLFSSETGNTIEQYIISQKIEKVKEWLSYGELTLTEIAWRLGYSSAAHLGNQFKKITGMTPGQYKKMEGLNRKTLDRI
ncbi:helix-turn-helix domain-containing protein [Arundinibacter roseus]|uniref:AraC family transcriptional regulator n=1 Tax=Arundinibacter roseus TaxID=2070510 RepID=A0A4R4K6K2_9BACT|nr:helix-turn-helix domain-containing protein [Arundinibacter roseus]TDB62312.1 AraC family transcriptional regulator [Arundinibacter roseus]